MGSLGVEFARNKAMWVRPKVLGAKPSERWGHSSCYFNGFLYIFGGCRGGTHFSDVLVCNLDTMTWNNLKTSGLGPGPRDSHSAVVVGHKMFVFGGTNGYKKVNDIHVLDLLSREWSCPECHGTLPPARESHTANSFNDEKLVVFGGSGEGEANYLNDLHILNLQSMEWFSPEVRGHVPAPCDSHSSVIVGNRLFVFGGDSGDRYQGDVSVLDMKTFIWSRLVVSGPSPGPRAGHTSVSVGTKVYIFGGVGDRKYYNDIWILDVIKSSWIQLDVPSPISGGMFSHTATITHLGIAIFGGCGEDERPLNELLILQIDSLMHKEESQMFLKKAEDNFNHHKFASDDDELRPKDVEELDFLSKESFHLSSDMFHCKRRRTSESKLQGSKSDLEDHSLSHSQHSSPSVSDHEPASVKMRNNAYASSRVHPLLRPRVTDPSNYQLHNDPLSKARPYPFISRQFQDVNLSPEHFKGTDSCQLPFQTTGNSTLEAVKFKNLVGAEVHGQVDGSFDSGYLMTATINGRVFRGVLFHPGPELSQRGVIHNEHPTPFIHHIESNHANARKNHFNVAYQRHHQQMKIIGTVPSHSSRKTQSRPTQDTRVSSLPLGRDLKLNSELQGVVLTLAPGSGP